MLLPLFFVPLRNEKNINPYTTTIKHRTASCSNYARLNPYALQRIRWGNDGAPWLRLGRNTYPYG